MAFTRWCVFYGGAPFALADHLDRITRSAAGIELQLSMSTNEFTALAYDLLDRSGIDDAEIYLQVTRGVV
jgi:D-alanine transaminase